MVRVYRLVGATSSMFYGDSMSDCPRRHLANSTACPQRGCYDCPKYAPGENPHFQLREQKAEHIRANEFKVSGEADQFRKVAKL